MVEDDELDLNDGNVSDDSFAGDVGSGESRLHRVVIDVCIGIADVTVELDELDAISEKKDTVEVDTLSSEQKHDTDITSDLEIDADTATSEEDTVKVTLRRSDPAEDSPGVHVCRKSHASHQSQDQLQQKPLPRHGRPSFSKSSTTSTYAFSSCRVELTRQ